MGVDLESIYTSSGEVPICGPGDQIVRFSWTVDATAEQPANSLAIVIRHADESADTSLLFRGVDCDTVSIADSKVAWLIQNQHLSKKAEGRGLKVFCRYLDSYEETVFRASAVEVA